MSIRALRRHPYLLAKIATLIAWSAVAVDTAIDSWHAAFFKPSKVTWSSNTSSTDLKSLTHVSGAPPHD